MGNQKNGFTLMSRPRWLRKFFGEQPREG